MSNQLTPLNTVDVSDHIRSFVHFSLVLDHEILCQLQWLPRIWPVLHTFRSHPSSSVFLLQIGETYNACGVRLHDHGPEGDSRVLLGTLDGNENNYLE